MGPCNVAAATALLDVLVLDVVVEFREQFERLPERRRRARGRDVERLDGRIGSVALAAGAVLFAVNLSLVVVRHGGYSIRELLPERA